MERTLVATIGSDERQVLPAMRLLPYDRLIVVGPARSFRSAGFRRLASIEPSCRRVTVDPFDLLACLETVRRTVRDASAAGPVRLSVGGGSKILSSAAILAGFQEGTETWYCDPRPIRLPVLRGLRVVEAFAPEETIIGSLVRRPVRADRLVRAAGRKHVSKYLATRAIQSLAAKGLLEVRIEGGAAVVRPTQSLAALRPHLRAEPRKA